MSNGIDLWMMTVRCARCTRPMTLAQFEKRDGGWNRYVYECEGGCDPTSARSIVEVPEHLDLTTRRREELDYVDPPAGFAGPDAPRSAAEIDNPEQGVFCADPPSAEGTE